jgi:hypothetical protein
MSRRSVLLAALLAFLASSAMAQSAPKPATAPGKARIAGVLNDQVPPPPPPPAPAGPRQPGQPPPPPGPPAPPARRGQPINVKVEVVITDQRGAAAPTKKTVSVIVADQMTGLIRSEAMIPSIGSAPLHVDAEPEILADGKIRLRFGLNYDLPAEGQQASDRIAKTSIRESVVLILESGKPLTVSQSADPVGDRQVMVEVKATVLK